jgi:hypothetical protein
MTHSESHAPHQRKPAKPTNPACVKHLEHPHPEQGPARRGAHQAAEATNPPALATR